MVRSGEAAVEQDVAIETLDWEESIRYEMVRKRDREFQD